MVKISSFKIYKENDKIVIVENGKKYDYANPLRDKFLYHYGIKEEIGSTFYDGILDIYHLNLSKFEKMSYTLEEVNKLSDLELVGLIFKTRTRKEMNILLERDERIMEIKKIFEEVTNDEEFIDEYSKEELEKLAYGDESAKEEKTEIAKNMLNINIPIDNIIKCTGLTKEEIEKLM